MSATVDLPLLELASDSGESFPVEDPATGATVAEAPRMGTAETRRAIEAAHEALPGWRGLLAKERARIMRRWADLMVEHEEPLARLLTREQGKPLAESRAEIIYAASFLEWFGEEAKRVYGDTIPTYMRDRRIVVTKQPTSNPLVRKLGFTGSTEIGKLLMAQCAAQVKKVSLELGGNAPFIVFDDADLDAAVAGALLCKFRNSGQTCISANRILVQAPVYDEFVRLLTDAAQRLKVGSGLDPDVAVGPLIEQGAIDKVERHVADALARGGELSTGGKSLGGLFYTPTVIVGVPADAAMSCEETFGPVAGIARFSSEEEAIRQANDTPYGLASYFYSRDMGRIWRVSEALEYGILGINTGMISTEVAPFGGMKESGIGREGSKYGIDEWLELKYLCMGGVE